MDKSCISKINFGYQEVLGKKLMKFDKEVADVIFKVVNLQV